MAKNNVKPTIVDLPLKLAKDLDAFCKANEVSKASVIRTGIKREIYVGKPLFKKLD